jgi:uncharacterized protein (DUF2235 family)
MNFTIGIFFDGTGNNINDKPSTITNIAKLFKVYGEAGDHAIKKLYIRGVGSEAHKDDNDRLGGSGIFSKGIDSMLGGALSCEINSQGNARRDRANV